jgi:hypothetical protein
VGRRKPFSVPEPRILELYETLFGTKQDVEKFEDFVMVRIPFFHVSLEDNTLTTKEQTVKIDYIRRYDYKGQPFCYDVMTTQYLHDPKTGSGGFGPVWNLRFYDMDADGTFETMEFITTATPLAIPDSIKSSAKH